MYHLTLVETIELAFPPQYKRKLIVFTFPPLIILHYFIWKLDEDPFHVPYLWWCIVSGLAPHQRDQPTPSKHLPPPHMSLQLHLYMALLYSYSYETCDCILMIYCFWVSPVLFVCVNISEVDLYEIKGWYCGIIRQPERLIWHPENNKLHLLCTFKAVK